jgi:hypothetical protein
MESGGNNLRDFFKNTELPTRVLIYPKLTPPEFKVSDISSKGCICIISQKEGLQDFVRGIIQGLGLFMKPVVLDLIQSRNEGVHTKYSK